MAENSLKFNGVLSDDQVVHLSCKVVELFGGVIEFKAETQRLEDIFVAMTKGERNE
ncbi:MAG: hypothetical protein R2827_04535 [Bdellovibrionales bacterium]